MADNDLTRPIKSFVIRGSRMTAAQQRAFEAHWQQQGCTAADGEINPPALFGRQAPLVLEVGFGMGTSLAEMAQNFPDTDFIGVDVHKPGVGNLLKEINLRRLSNVRVYWEDVTVVLKQCISEQSLDRVQIFFPDPWQKRRHHKRRLVQDSFVQLLRSKLCIGGILHMATDWQPYAGHMLSVMQSAQGFRNTVSTGGFAERPDYRPLTKFEQRGQRLGHGVWDLLFERVD